MATINGKIISKVESEAYMSKVQTRLAVKLNGYSIQVGGGLSAVGEPDFGDVEITVKGTDLFEGLHVGDSISINLEKAQVPAARLAVKVPDVLPRFIPDGMWHGEDGRQDTAADRAVREGVTGIGGSVEVKGLSGAGCG